MSDKPTTSLPAATTPDGTELLPGVQGGNSRKFTLQQISDLARKQGRVIPFFFTTTPTASEVLALYAVTDAFNLLANLAGSVVVVGTNPAATFAITIAQNGTAIGTISISTGGAVTLTTVGGTVKALAIGDIIKFTAPVTPDTTIANVAINIKGS